MNSPLLASPLLASPFAGEAAPGIDPPVGCEAYGGVMTVGFYDGNKYGYNSDFPSGAMVPDTIQGTFIYGFTSLNETGSMSFDLLPAQEVNNIPVPGQPLNITIDNNEHVEFVYSGGSYTAFDAPLVTYLISKAGQQVQVCINWGEEPEGEG